MLQVDRQNLPAAAARICWSDLFQCVYLFVHRGQVILQSYAGMQIGKLEVIWNYFAKKKCDYTVYSIMPYIWIELIQCTCVFVTNVSLPAN